MSGEAQLRQEPASTDTASSKGVLPEIAEICTTEGRWVDLDPPTREQERSEPNIIGNWVDEEGRLGEEGVPYPIKVGFMTETRESSDVELHKVFRTSKYNVHFRIKSINDELAKGQVFVREAEGYD